MRTCEKTDTDITAETEVLTIAQIFLPKHGDEIKLFQAGSCRLNDRHLHEKLSRPHSKRKTSTTCTGPTAINGQARKGIASRSTCMSSMLPTLTAELEVAY